MFIKYIEKNTLDINNINTKKEIITILCLKIIATNC